MPKKLLTAEVAQDIATLAVNNQLLSLVIDKYKSGKSKGEYFADYTEGERTIDVNTINVLQSIPRIITAEQKLVIHFEMKKDQPPFVRWEKDGE